MSGTQTSRRSFNMWATWVVTIKARAVHVMVIGTARGAYSGANVHGWLVTEEHGRPPGNRLH